MLINTYSTFALDLHISLLVKPAKAAAARAMEDCLDPPKEVGEEVVVNREYI